jgi:endonuclease YncB( thermonuclease family)
MRAMSQHWNPNDSIIQFRRSGGGGGSTGLTLGVLLAAAFVGVGAGALLSWKDAPPAAPIASSPAVEQKLEIVAPLVEVDPSDSEWTSRGGAVGTASTGSTRSVERGSVSASFGSCKWGGGTNCVVDGDTFYLNGAKVRIAGIDAPETHDYRCASELQLGEQAASQLQALLNSGAVTMTRIDRDRDAYGRLLRNVAVNGQDVGEALISAGLAREYGGGRRPWC